MYPFYITREDQRILQELATAFSVDLSNYELSDPDDFYRARGEIIAKIVSKIENDLRPEDPYVSLLKELREEDVRQMEGERA